MVEALSRARKSSTGLSQDSNRRRNGIIVHFNSGEGNGKAIAYNEALKREPRVLRDDLRDVRRDALD